MIWEISKTDVFWWILAALAYAWSCMVFYRVGFADDPFFDELHPRWSEIFSLFWPLVLLLGALMVWRDMYRGYPR